MLSSTDPTNVEEIDDTLDGAVVKVPGIIAIFVPVFLGVPALFYATDGFTMFLLCGIIVPLFLSSIVFAFVKTPPPRYVRAVSALGVVSLLILSLILEDDSDNASALVFSVSTLCICPYLIGRAFHYFEETLKSLRDQQGTSTVDLDSTFWRIVDTRLATTLRILGVLLVLGYLLTLVSILLDSPSLGFLLFAFVSMTLCFGSLFYLLVMFFLVHGPVQQQLRRRREAAATIATGPSLYPQQSHSDTLVELSTPLVQSSARLEHTCQQETEDILIV